ncbi:catalase isozyme 1 [Nicotiana attenuata]|uniref:Catalase isozyme 1 n=1 Tax=Nicotiana attenuata TaxID=49451 RepID=A0A1J6IYU3_NICAT|nr:catalase isozyme 1 [Nicotiana attenuata]
MLLYLSSIFFDYLTWILSNDQLAFCSAIVVLGIYYSVDKLLQIRIFSYSDTRDTVLGQTICSSQLTLPSVLITIITMKVS